MAALAEVHNQYVGLRHGKSLANEKGIIISGIRGIFRYGLIEEGKKQVYDSITAANKQGILDENTIIVTSPMKRARQTAYIAAELLCVPRRNVKMRFGLRERYFGKYEGGSNKYYHDVWGKDTINQNKRVNRVESAEHVKGRELRVIRKMEKRYQNKKILFVGHGDPLQILEATFNNLSPGEHRSVEGMKNASLRQFKYQFPT